MEMFNSSYSTDNVDWHEINGEPDFDEYKLCYKYSILGYDTAAGKLDMLMKFSGDGGYCERHRHVAATTTLVLEGEQHLEEWQADGSVKKIVRKAGDYAMAQRDALPHMETGGPEGGTVLLSLHTSSGILFEVLDANYEKIMDVTIEEFVERWTAREA